MNKKIRRQGKLSAYEIHAARDGNTGENLHLNDQDIRTDHLQGRKAARKPVNSTPPVIQVGDTVVMKEKQNKHKAREAFVVTGLEKDQVQAQKLLHPLESGKVKFMSKVYSTDAKNVVVARRARAQQSWSSPHLSQLPVPSPPVCSSPGYDPVNSRFWSDDDESDEDHEDVVLEQAHAPPDHAGEEQEVDLEDSHGEEEAEDDLAREHESNAASNGSEADIVDSEGEEQDEQPLEASMVAPLDQSRRPKKGDVISYGIELDTEHERWGEAVVTSVSRTPHYYNVQRLDTHEKLGIYLLPNTAWHLGPRLECEREPLMHPSSRETSPLLLRREEREFRYQFEVDYFGEPLLLSGELKEDKQ